MKKTILILSILISSISCFGTESDTMPDINQQIYHIYFNKNIDKSQNKDSVKTVVKHKRLKSETPYASVGTSFSSAKDFGFGVESGLWGTGDNPITYSIVANYSHNLNSKSNNVFIGIKTYYFFFSKNQYSMYVYLAPQAQAYNSDLTALKKFDFLFEYGVGGAYGVGSHLIIQYGIFGQTVYSSNTTTPAVGISFNYIK